MKAKKSVLFLLFIGLCAAAVSAQTEADFEVDLTADGAGVVIKKYVGKASQVRIPATIFCFWFSRLPYLPFRYKIGNKTAQ